MGCCRRNSPASACALVALLLILIGACVEPQTKPDDSVADAWQKSTPRQPPSPTPRSQHVEPAPDLIEDTGDWEAAIAYVDGRPISRERIINLLIAGHGVGVLEQAVVLESAKVLAAEQGITVSPKDIDAEFDLSLRNLTSPLRAADEAEFDREEAERILTEVLARRNVSRAECMAMIERNAYLRAICAANLAYTDEQYIEEYRRTFGPRVQVRHIQLANLAEAEGVMEHLRSGGEFTKLAKAYSANLRTAPEGGLLRPFSREDPDVPAVLSETAFKLREGETSNPLRIDQWYHIIRVERTIPPDDRPIAEVKPELERRLRERMTESAMQTLYRTLFEQADIRIVDPTLAEEFMRKHPDHSAGTRNVE